VTDTPVTLRVDMLESEYDILESDSEERALKELGDSEASELYGLSTSA